ncbi:thioredoxin domain-containing protein [Methyloversatilis thermotolerans]|uniref:thioredoxin domain-containing protein n=1 Tax=Methyloversatilis thermotolerans TaxID=1346290 RepID=UPI00037727F9|nr:thioredoxin domain-containing protein [Methyloversatilis thermotolerans]
MSSAPASNPRNRLPGASSAYLQQHAADPVNWYPWGEEAFAEASRRDLPILLSIGYASCHWCHVMARESFADAATAAVLNEGFVAIKVDREERPDIDGLYQQALQLLRRSHGGWPLTVFMSPEGVPFYGGTYFPREASGGQSALRDVLASVSTVWSERRADLARQDEALIAAMNAARPHASGPAIDPTVQDQAIQQLATAFDARHGGFGGAPKFPHPTDLDFLLQLDSDVGTPSPRTMVLASLRHMAEGGLFDQLGGGFFRYSVDPSWQIPHFEKMLCDSAMLLPLYADAWARTGDPLFRRVVELTVGWAERDMRADDGLFCSALAADGADGREGAVYLWDAAAVREPLSPVEWDLCSAHWGLIDPPGFEGKSWHLRVARSAEKLADTFDQPEAAVQAVIDGARGRLLNRRDDRARAARDGKTPTAWNALMVSALARAGAHCQRPDWTDAARRTLDALRSTRWQADVDGMDRLQSLPGVEGFLDDHAFLLDALLDLHDHAPQEGDLAFATRLADVMMMRFEDDASGGFFFTAHDALPLFHRAKPGLDAATPSGNGIAALALIRLGRRTGSTRYRQAAERCVRLFAATVRADPASHTRLLTAARLLDEGA